MVKVGIGGLFKDESRKKSGNTVAICVKIM